MQTTHKARYLLSNGKIIENGRFSVKNGSIIPDSPLPEVIDHGNALVTPGFINLHTHLQYTDIKPCAKHSSFTDWIISLIRQYFFWSREKKINSLKNGLEETVRSGVTCVVNLAIEEEFIEVLEDQPIKSYSFLETFADTEERSKKEFRRLVKCLEKYNTSNVGISPHSPYNVHPVLWEKLRQTGVLLHTHLAESAEEMAWLRGDPSGINKLHKFVRFQTFNPYKIAPFDNLIAAHLNQLDIEEAGKFKIAHCPRSNMILHGKTLNLSGDTSNIGLGTDSKSSNYDLNILKEAKFVKDRAGLGFIEIMNMLTTNAARMLRIDNKIGSLESGKDADFLVFKLNEGQGYEEILNREGPDEVYVRGIRL